MKKLLKKSLLTFLSLLLIMSLVSCNNKKVEEEVKEEETKEVVKQEVVEETKQEEVKEETIIEEPKEEKKQQDVTKMYFWVVFYDQYGEELQREALKYGTVPEYKSWFPEGFDNWVYKKSGKEVKEFKPITGNTYFKAKCHEVYHENHEPSGPTIVTLWEGEAVADDYANQPYILSDSGTELKEQNAQPGDVVCFHISIIENPWDVEVKEGHWGPLYKLYMHSSHPEVSNKIESLGAEWVEAINSNDKAILQLTLTQEMLDAAYLEQWWGGVFVLNGDNVICTKVTLLKN